MGHNIIARVTKIILEWGDTTTTLFMEGHRVTWAEREDMRWCRGRTLPFIVEEIRRTTGQRVVVHNLSPDNDLRKIIPGLTKVVKYGGRSE